MTMRFPLFAYLSLLFIFAGCASHSASNLAGKNVSAELVHQQVRENQNRIRTMTGSGRITVETPTMAQNGSFEITLRKPDSLLVKLEGPFGMEVGAALITRKEFFFYNSLRNQLITGPTNTANLSRILRVNIGFEDIINLFGGGSFFPDDKLEADENGIDDDQFVLAYRHFNGTRRYFIDPTSLLIVKVEHLDQGDNLVIEQRYSNFRTVEDVSIPMRIRFIQHLEQRSLAISYSDLSINVDSLQLTFSVPSNATHIRWE